jgi:hypothetical protein
MILRRSRFRAVIVTQLELFERDHHDVLEEAEAKLDRYTFAERDDAEELYGDYVDAIETGTELLADVRDRYAASLDETDQDRYVAEFNKAVARRLQPFALEIENR